MVVGETGSERLALGQIVSGTPEGDVAYTVFIGGGEAAALSIGSVAEAEVVLIEDFAAACSLLSGASVASLLEQGRIKLRGAVATLLRCERQLAALGAALTAPKDTAHR